MNRLIVLLAPLTLVVLTGCYTAEEVWGTDAPSVAGEYVVGMSDAASEASLRELAQDNGLQLIEARGYDRLAVLVDPSGREQADVLELLDASDQTDYAEPQYIYSPFHQPDDYGTYLWGLHNTGGNGGRAEADIDAFEAWDITNGSGVTIAVIDSGIDAAHPDLAPNLWTNPGEIAGNGIDDDGNGYVDDVHGYDFVNDDGDPADSDGHGTHVAGSAAARGDDGEGVVGVAYGAKIMTLQFFDGNAGGYSSIASAAIRYAVNNGADVINASWGSYGSSTAIYNAIAYARSHGVMFIAAAGNEGNDNDSYGLYPASYDLDNVISVAASDRNDRLVSYSNYGSSKVDLAAPGDQIVSTWPGSDWAYLDGTSMAAPHVAGVVALLRSVAPEASVADVRQALLDSAEPLASGASRVATGGRLSARGALDLILASSQPEEPEEPEEPAPTEWTWVDYSVESAHPYTNNYSGQVGITAPAGATSIRLHFDRIDVEANYDFVVVKDTHGAKLAEWSGDLGAVDSQEFPVGQLTLHLYTDSSVTEWGLALSGYSWR